MSNLEWGFDWFDGESWHEAYICEDGCLEEGRSWWPTRDEAEVWAVEGLDGAPYRMVKKT